MNVSRSSDATPSSFILSRADTMKAGLKALPKQTLQGLRGVYWKQQQIIIEYLQTFFCKFIHVLHLRNKYLIIIETLGST